MNDPILTIELVPRTAWFSNVRTNVTSNQWDSIRKPIYRAAHYRCEICGGAGPDHPVECHEVWHYDDEHKIQTLVRMLALCPACHMVKHIGLAGIRGKKEEALKHLAMVNKWRIDQAHEYAAEQFGVWRARSTHQWVLDLNVLLDYGIAIPKEGVEK